MTRRRELLLGAAILAVTSLMAVPSAQKGGKNGTTLAGYKTIDICELPDGQWRYSGEIAVWNEGVIDTQGFTITDCIQNNAGGQFSNVYCAATFDPALQEILAGTTELTGTTFKYEVVGAPLQGDIRNSAQISILNHSGSIGTPKGPNPKATWLGTVEACPLLELCGCTYTQGYWGNKPGVVWPAGFDRNAPFFLSGLTWQQVLDLPVGGNGYFILAKQYISAILNQTNNACVPSGIQDTLDLATAWFGANTQGTDKIGTGKDAIPATGCYVGGSCGPQKDWGAILDDYNNGVYQNGPQHCGDEQPVGAVSSVTARR
jgi:hypothetical protein